MIGHLILSLLSLGLLHPLVPYSSSLLNKILVPLRKPLPRSRLAICQEFLCKLKESEMKIWEKSPRFAKMLCIDPNIKLNRFAKLTHNLHWERTSLLFQSRIRHIPLNMYLQNMEIGHTLLSQLSAAHGDHNTLCPALSSAQQSQESYVPKSWQGRKRLGKTAIKRRSITTPF